MLTLAQAQSLDQSLESLTVPELRRLGKQHFGMEWLSSANKARIVKGLHKRMAEYIRKQGA